MKNKFGVKIFLLIMVVICFTPIFCGCDFIFNSGVTKTVSGTVTFEHNGLENVSIRYSRKQFTKTDENGEFSFETKLSDIIIYAEKDGYLIKEKYELKNDSLTNLTFVGELITPIENTVKLEKIIIKPISIVGLFDNNFSYEKDNKECLKIGLCEAVVGNQTFSDTTERYLAKNEKNEILVTDNISVDLSVKNEIFIKFKLNAFFKCQQMEMLFSQETYTLISQTNLTNANILENDKIMLTAYGINSNGSNYTCDISFVFGIV